MDPWKRPTAPKAPEPDHDEPTLAEPQPEDAAEPQLHDDAATLDFESELDREINIDVMPLSAFTPPLMIVDDFQPRLEVEEFGWPMQVDMLLARAREHLVSFAAGLLAEAARGSRLLAISATARAEGATTALLAIARQAASLGGAVAIVDADRARPHMARLLGVEAILGWDQALEGEIGLDEALVISKFDRVALVPWRERATAVEFHEIRAGVAMEMLREHFDLVLVDTGPINGASVAELAAVARIDGCYLVSDGRHASPSRLDEALTMAEQLGWPPLGVLENFSPAMASGSGRGAA